MTGTPVSRIARRAWARWCSYWLAPGGQYSAAALRIAIAVSLLWLLSHDYPIADQPASASYYRIGIWQLYPGRPGPELLSVIEVIAWLSTAALLVGAWTRTAHAISLISVLALATYGVSDTPTWSHADAPPLLASFAFLGARGGDVLAVDAWWRRWRGRAQPAPAAYQASVRLVQIAVAAVFLIAGYCKLRAGGGLAWALSDNLRNQLLVRFDWLQLPRTPVAQWLLGAPWRYELCAMLNLISQTSQLAAVFLVRRPVWRALIGALYCAEVIGLAVVMDLWNLNWLALAAAYIDWDALVAWRRGPAPAATAPVHGRGRVAFATAFVVFFALQAFWFNQRLRAFPFSSFPMFAAVRAKRPYDRHQTYELIGGRIELLASRPLTHDEQTWIDSRSTYRWMWHDRDPAQLRRDLQVILDENRRRLPGAGITGVRLWLSVFRAPASPAPARLDRIDVAIIGELDAGGTLRTALGTLARDRVTLSSAPLGVDLAGASLAVMRDDVPPPQPLAARATATGWTLEAPLTGDPVHVVAIPPGSTTPWLVAGQSHRGY
ncbi:MAG TPA: hypothetical protein VFT22_41205 [Kofleriaceae bacterium]|nr:hypothetical protein [Kofleriaceae bacterium]